jgi:hypothetical protein
MRFMTIVVALLVMVLVCGRMSNAQIPRTLSYQGVLTDSLGNPKPNGTYSLTFRLYDVESDGSALWTEAKTLNVERGLFSTNLGDQVSFGSGVAFDKQYWLGIQVAGGPELSPRIRLSAVGYSMNSTKTDTAQYARKAPPQTSVDTARIALAVPDASITSAKIQDGTIRFADIGQNGATSGQVIKWGSSGWAPEADATGGGSGGWTDDGTVIRMSTGSDTVVLGSVGRLGKLNVAGDIGFSLPASLCFGSDATRISGMIGGDMRLTAGDLSMLTTEDITFGHFGDEEWVKFDNANKRVGIGTLSPVDRLHVVKDDTAPCWMRIESAHATNWGQTGLRIKTPQNMWNLRMDLYSNANLPDGALSLYSQDGSVEAMTWLEDGRVGIGTNNPTRKLHVNGSVQVRDTLYAGRIQPSLLSASRLPDEPGVAASTTSIYAYMQVEHYWSPIDSVEMTVPAAGYVVGVVCASAQTSHTYLDMGTLELGLSTSPTSAGSYQSWHLPPQLGTGTFSNSLSVNCVFQVPAAGPYKFYSVTKSYDDDVFHVSASATTFMYFPTAYGEAPSAMMLGAGEGAPTTTRAQAARAGSVGSRQGQPPSDFVTLQNQVQTLTRELQALRDEVKSGAK